jgi:hypothetical protein
MRHSATFIKRALSSALAVTLITGATAPAFALTNDSSIVNTGDHVKVDATAQHESETKVHNSNHAVVKQTVDIQANTGGNTANGNIGSGGGISTGAVAATAQMGVMANSNTTLLAANPGSMGSATTTDVVSTGDKAHIDVSTKSKQATSVVNHNTAHVMQAFKTTASTGDNQSNGTIGSTGIMTGGIAVGAALDTAVNDNKTMIGLGGPSASQQNVAVVTNTGDKVEVDSHSSAQSYVHVKNHNAAKINQVFDANLKTGNNKANNGIGDSKVVSGGIMALGALDSKANSNMTLLSSPQQAGMSLGTVDIVNTGDKLDSHSTTKTSQKLMVLNYNSLYEYSNAKIKLNSGNNYSNGAIGSALISSGTAHAGAQMETMGNENSTVLGTGAAAMLAWLAGMF